LLIRNVPEPPFRRLVEASFDFIAVGHELVPLHEAECHDGNDKEKETAECKVVTLNVLEESDENVSWLEYVHVFSR
jgi:hypothetical protein